MQLHSSRILRHNNPMTILSRTYPQNVLIAAYSQYDVAMNRLDYRLSTIEQDANVTHMQRTIQASPLQYAGMLDKLFDQLPENRRRVAALRFRSGKTLKETGKALDISGERVRQLQESILKYLRTPEVAQQFLDALWPNHG